MKLVTADQMRALEQRADQNGNTFAAMMERAGSAVATALAARLPPLERGAHSVLVLTGPGNNGGDGLVCARVLHDAGIPVSLYIWKRADKGDDPNLKMCIERNMPIARAESDPGWSVLKERVRKSTVIVDALLGTGVTRPIKDTLKDLLGVVKAEIVTEEKPDWQGLVPWRAPAPRAGRMVVAVDLPSGLNPDTGALDPAALPAWLTVTFAFPKIGQLLFPGAGAVGELLVADIGIPEAWAEDVWIEVATALDIARKLPARPDNSNKGTFGKAMICAGSLNYTGAAYLAGSAATRAGAGLVTLALAHTIHPLIAAAVHETTFLPLPDADGALVPQAVEVLANALGDYDALLLGPGFGRHPQTIEFVRGMLTSAARTMNMVIDADALYALSQTPDWWTALGSNTVVLTPHPGEMATLCGLDIRKVQQDRIETARTFAARWRQVVILKGAHTGVASPDGRVTLIPFATPALATAGTGDVLAGTITALLAQKLEPFDAAVVGTYIHGLAGNIVAEEIGRAGAVAGDLLPRLPQAIRRVLFDLR